jgi:hypothetical protein
VLYIVTGFTVQYLKFLQFCFVAHEQQLTFFLSIQTQKYYQIIDDARTIHPKNDYEVFFLVCIFRMKNKKKKERKLNKKTDFDNGRKKKVKQSADNRQRKYSVGNDLHRSVRIESRVCWANVCLMDL